VGFVAGEDFRLLKSFGERVAIDRLPKNRTFQEVSLATKSTLRGKRFCREEAFFGRAYRWDLEGRDRGAPVLELCGQHRILEQSYYRWRKLYGNMGPSEARELRQLHTQGEQKAQALGRGLVARQGDVAGCSPKNVLKPAPKRQIVKYLMDRYSVGA
jgi:putative transposase